MPEYDTKDVSSQSNFKRKRAERSLPISAKAWETARIEIHLKYIIDDCTQGELLDWLQQKYRLFPSHRQLTLQLKKWEYFKKGSYLRPEASKQKKHAAETITTGVSPASICWEHLKLCSARGTACDSIEKGPIGEVTTKETGLDVSAASSIYASWCLTELGLFEHARVSRQAFWNSLSLKPAMVDGDGELVPSLSAMALFSHILYNTCHAQSIVSCIDILALAKWREWCPQEVEKARHVLDCTICDSIFRLKLIGSSCISLASKTTIELWLRQFNVVITRKHIDQSVLSIYRRSEAQAGQFQLLLADGQVLCLSKPTDLWSRSYNMNREPEFQLTRDFTFIISGSAAPMGMFVGRSQPSKSSLIASNCCMFHLITICYELFYGGYLQLEDGSLSMNRPVFDLLISDLATVVRSSETDAGAKFSQMVYDQTKIVQFIITNILLPHHDVDAEVQSPPRIALEAILIRDSVETEHQAARQYTEENTEKRTETPTLSKNSVAKTLDERKKAGGVSHVSSLGVSSISELDSSHDSVISRVARDISGPASDDKHADQSHRSSKGRNTEPLKHVSNIILQPNRHGTIAPEVNDIQKGESADRSLSLLMASEPDILPIKKDFTVTRTHSVNGPIEKEEPRFNAVMKRMTTLDAESDDVVAKKSDRSYKHHDTYSSTDDVVEHSDKTSLSVSATKATTSSPAETTPVYEDQDPLLPKHIVSPSLEAFRTLAKKQRRGHSTSSRRSQPSTISMLSLGLSSDRMSITRYLKHSEPRRSDIGSLENLSEDFATLSTSSRSAQPRKKRRSQQTKDVGLSNKISFGTLLFTGR